MIPTIIVAASDNHVIGRKNQLPWHMPADLRFFKETTLHHTVIMGRKSFDSLGKPLPHRWNIIISRQTDWVVPGGTVVSDPQAALDLARSETTEPEREVFILGGEQIYRWMLDRDLIERIYLTRIHHTFEGDTFFPELDLSNWLEVRNDRFPADARNPWPYRFITYERKRTS